MIDFTFQIADVRKACKVLARWDRTSNLDSKGAVFFARFTEHMLTELDTITATLGTGAPDFYRVPFDVTRPVETPTGLRTGAFLVSPALARTVNEFRWVGLPLDATLRQSSYSTYGGERTPLHGSDVSGAFNIIEQRWKNTGYEMGGGSKEYDGGASFVMVTSFTGGCVDDRSLLLGSQRSGESGWPLATGQLKLYADKQWVDPPFCDGELAVAGVRSVTALDPDAG
jgi:acyl-homoserine-lactone acylase